MERVLIIIHDAQQLIQCPPLHHDLKRLKPETKCRASFLNNFGSDAAAPTHSTKENGNNTLIEYLQHLAAHVEGYQLPQEIVCSSPSCTQPQY